ncbi:MAG: hypothetical protein ACRC1K_22080, partial [Planctomycetia bacterium]
MNQREKVLGAVVVLIVGAYFAPKLFDGWLAAPLRAKDAELADLEKQVKNKLLERETTRDAEFDLGAWTAAALPGETNVAQTLYEEYLHQLLTTAKIEKPTVTPSAVQTKADHLVRLPFAVRMHCSLDQLADFLHRFYGTKLLHQVRRLSLKPIAPDGKTTPSDRFDVQLTVEAVSLADATAKDRLPAPSKGPSAPMPPEFTLFADKNVFRPTQLAPKGTDVAPAGATDRSQVVLTGSMVVDGAGKLWFTNRKTNTRLYVSVGEVLEAEGFRGDVVEASPD